ncbi:PREDICTED: coiled-coil and C2 domain-containing protein 2A-like [Gavialis gangeticus]|uniref:coiled-coil and C2 domain-containing protein 2A-like n=1 Tax=Gavialis gangeticus TaxID=94835 RepID=UPI00092F072A|nr:PREDICTED: coiled-coil and C2 domain-containing protein 2A-like [Gavialis gangeticus]
MSGKLMYSLSWTADEGNIPLASILQPINSASYRVPRNTDEEIATGILWFTDTQKFTEWAKKVKTDPNDPEYSNLMDFILYTRSKEETLPKYFRLEQLQKEFNFVTEEEIKNCKRFQLLQLRNSGQLDSCYCWQIPMFDREIPDIVFQGYESRLKTEVSVTDEDPISAQRISSANFIRKEGFYIVYFIVISKCFPNKVELKANVNCNRVSGFFYGKPWVTLLDRMQNIQWVEDGLTIDVGQVRENLERLDIHKSVGPDNAPEGLEGADGHYSMSYGKDI